jgi:putative ABC transport system permease protein
MATLSLARSTLLHEWRRFLAAGLAVTFAGLLLLVQLGLLLGLFRDVSVMVDQSSADAWVGFRGLQSVDEGRPVSEAVPALVLNRPEVARLEALYLAQGEWRKPDGTKSFASVQGVDPGPDGMGFARLLTPGLRERLRIPGGVLLDEADLARMGAEVGGNYELNGQRAVVVGTVRGIRGTGMVNLLASQATARGFSQPRDQVPSYYLVRLRPGGDPAALRAALEADGARRSFEVYPSGPFSASSQRFWLLESGAGLGTLFSVLMGLFVGAAITSQVLMATVLANVREYATLRALGVTMGSLRKVVLEQSAWIGGAGLATTLVAVQVLRPLAGRFHVPFSVPVWGYLLTAALVGAIALGSGLVALRGLRSADPGSLLR